MKRYTISLGFMVLLTIIGCGQDMATYTSLWRGKIADVAAFTFDVELEWAGAQVGTIVVTGKEDAFELRVRRDASGRIEGQTSDGLQFRGYELPEEGAISGFMQSGALQYHMQLTEEASGHFRGRWRLFMVDSLNSPEMFLSVENGSGDVYQAYPFWADLRFTGTWCAQFEKKAEQLTFQDFKTGLTFRGELGENEIQLEMYLGGALVARVPLRAEPEFVSLLPTDRSEAPVPMRHASLQQMEALIAADSLPNVHAVLAIQQGKVCYERYFDGYYAALPHDMRSASKSVGSAITGLAVHQGLLSDVEEPLAAFIPSAYQDRIDEAKARIDFQSLLTMSSGLDADDLRNSPASEGAYQSSEDWLATVLDAPMMYGPNEHANYGSANPFLLGVALDSIVSEPLSLFLDRFMFRQMGISDYIVQNDNTGKAYLGGGMYMTPRDMAKFGQLYLQAGAWEGEQLLSRDWVEASMRAYRPLENVRDKNPYGYLFWHHSYPLGGEQIHTVEARGFGGQYIYIIPSLEAVVVITSGNFRNGKTQQPEDILARFILPILQK